jgi:uncharacterized protein (TIGR03437 family)
MLRLTICFLIATLFLIVFVAPSIKTASTVRRLTQTPEQSLNLNPSLSDDGNTVVFESSSDVFGASGNSQFRAIRADISGTLPVFSEIGSTRIVSPALSSDARVVAFASTEDLVGQNPDRNSEIFALEGPHLRQLTHTQPASTRLNDGNFHPSITADGRTIAFASNRNLTGENGDFSYEIFLYDKSVDGHSQLTNGTESSFNPQLSADGTRIYFRRVDAEQPDSGDLMLIDRTTGTTSVLASEVQGLFLTEGRAVSNDGMRLVYSAEVAPNQTQVFLYDARDNSIRQVTQLSSRVSDVRLQPTISGDGKRVAFATRRRVTSTSDGSVELYVLDLPTNQVQQVTNAPAGGTAEVVSSLNFDGSLVAFSFPRLLSGPTIDEGLGNNSEIYVASVAARPLFGAGTVVNAAKGNEPAKQLAPGSIASFRGSVLAFRAKTGDFTDGIPPFSVAGTTVQVNGHAARVFYAAPDEVIFLVPDGVAIGPAEVIVTNAEGFSSKAQIVISSAAPGIFTGHGEAIILDTDLLTPGPFDPSDGKRRVSIFATGVARASNASIKVNGVPVPVETVTATNITGIDEIRALIPAELRGAGSSTLVVEADGALSNAVSIVIGGDPPPPPPNKIVISQIFAGGGNSGAPYRNDFIEIFNAGSSTVSLAGWSVQYASATASTWSVTALSQIVLSPGQYYLIQEASGGSNGASLPTPDATGTIAMAAGAGKVALVRNSTPLSGACPTDPNIIDIVGYGGTANCFRGGPAPAGSNTNALLRVANGCTDTQNNAADFIRGTPNPRNSLLQGSFTCPAESETLRLAHALAQRRHHNSAPALWLRRFP